MGTDKEKLINYEEFHWITKEYHYSDLPEKVKAEVQEICQPNCESWTVVKQGSLAPLILIVAIILLMLSLYIKYLNGISIPDSVSNKY